MRLSLTGLASVKAAAAGLPSLAAAAKSNTARARADYEEWTAHVDGRQTDKLALLIPIKAGILLRVH